MMMIWFECKKDKLMIGLETDTKPTVGDTILVEGREYDVKKGYMVFRKSTYTIWNQSRNRKPCLKLVF